MKCLVLIIATLILPLLNYAQVEDLSKAKIIFSVNKQNAYILMDDTLRVINGKIFNTDTGSHSVKIWAPKQKVLDTLFNVKSNVHLNRQFFDLQMREDFKKRRNNDIIVACVLGVSAPILLSIDTKYEPFDLAPYHEEISKWEAAASDGDQVAQQNLLNAQENLEFVEKQNDEEKKKANLRKGIVTGILVAELAGLTTYLIHRAFGKKLSRTNPLITNLQIGPQLGLNHAGLGLGYKF